MADRPIRILIAKPGLDGHDRGARVLTQACKDAGMEVIYTGIRSSKEEIVTSAVQEDVDVLGLSILSGAHNAVIPDILDELAEYGADDIVVAAGGVIPEQDHEFLLNQGVDVVFTQDDSIDDIIAKIENLVANERPPTP